MVVISIVEVLHSNSTSIKFPLGHESISISPDSLPLPSTKGADPSHNTSFVDDNLSNNQPPSILSTPALDNVYASVTASPLTGTAGADMPRFAVGTIFGADTVRTSLNVDVPEGAQPATAT